MVEPIIENPQFPHSCKVTRSVDKDNPNERPDTVVVLEGKCQTQINEVGDTVWKEGVLYSDYTTYLPLDTEMKAGAVKKNDRIEINDGARIIVGIVTQFEKGNIGIRIWSDREHENQ